MTWPDPKTMLVLDALCRGLGVSITDDDLVMVIFRTDRGLFAFRELTLESQEELERRGWITVEPDSDAEAQTSVNVTDKGDYWHTRWEQSQGRKRAPSVAKVRRLQFGRRW